MALSIPGIKSAEEILEPTQIRTAQRGKRLRSIGWFGVLTSVALLAVSGFASWSGSKAFALAGFLLTLSIALINWTRIWVRESKEPFQFTFSVAEFEPGPDRLASFRPDADGTPLAWLRRDLIERLSKQVRRLSLLDESEAPDDDSEEGLARHVHVSGWYGLRRHANDDWYLEVKPRVRLGAHDAPERMARTIRFLLGDLQSVTDEPAPPAGERAAEETPPRPTRLPREEYERLFERVYWSVASEVYAQIRHGVEAKVRLLPPGRLRAAAYLYEADDYAASNTIDATRRPSPLSQGAGNVRPEVSVPTRYGVAEGGEPRPHPLRQVLGLLRLQLSKLLRRFGRREILTARRSWDTAGCSWPPGTSSALAGGRPPPSSRRRRVSNGPSGGSSGCPRTCPNATRLCFAPG